MFLGKRKLLPGQIIIVGFAAVILIGALILTLPIATADGKGASFSDAIFTTTSAVCVTGLVVQDTGTYWSTAGQAVIIALIQIGGMGVVTVALGLSMLAGRRIGLSQRSLMQESLSAPQVGGIVRMTGFIIRGTITIELIGAFLLSLRFVPQFGFIRGVWYGLFHSISAFCNAGFDILGGHYGEYCSLTAYETDPLVSFTIASLIIIGGIGFYVWDDIRRKRADFKIYRLQSKMALSTTAMLLIIPTVFLFFYEFSDAKWGLTEGFGRLTASFFQTVTPRTAGFNTVDLTMLTEPSVYLLTALMLIGGSPGSTAGGFKTTTLASIIFCIRSVLRKSSDIQCFGRRIGGDILRHTLTIFSLYIFLFFLGSFAICCLEGVTMTEAFFETASAIGTVGLTLGITPGLGQVSRAILIALMFFGRVGGLTLLYALSGMSAPAPGQLPREEISVG